MDECVFCKKSLNSKEPVVTLSQKRCDGISKANEARGSQVTTIVGQKVHVKCRQNFVNPKLINSFNRKRASTSSENNDARVLRSSASVAFDYKRDCVFCGFSDPYDGKKQSSHLFQSEL